MNAKEYLQQLEKIEAIIMNKFDEMQHWINIAKGITTQMGTERVQSTGSKQRMEGAVVEYVSLEQEYKEYIADLKAKHNEIIETMQQLEMDDYIFLHNVYVKKQSFSEVAESCQKSYTWATTQHGKALANLQKILDARKQK
jgi:queuine/archaeosine tRNA-ribosyltransferase